MLFVLLFSVGVLNLSPTLAVVENYMNTSVSPCEDFYQFACGEWSKVNSDVEHGDTLSILDMAMNEKIARLLESIEPSQITDGLLVKMRTFYRSCRNLKNYSLEEFLNSVKPKSDWAVNEISWKAQHFSWMDTIAELRKYSLNIFLEHAVMPKWDNTSVNLIYLDVAKVHPISKASLLELLKKASIGKPRAETIADELVAFERQLGEIIPKGGQSAENDDSEEVVLGYLTESLPKVNWVRYLSILFGKELDLYTPMITQNTEVMAKLVTFLDKSQPRLVCNYIMVKFLQFLDQHSIDDTSRNECVSALHQSMPLAVDFMIESNFYDHEHDQVVQDLFNFLKVEFLVEVSKLYENQRDVLLFLYTKASIMDLQIGNSKRNLSSKAVSDYYEGLQFEDEHFHANLLSAFKYKTAKDLKSLSGTAVDIAYQWTVTPSPFFVQPKNRIVVPLTLLQERILGKEPADKYSVLGFIIGHEFLHGFDVNGVNYNYEGSMVESAVSRNPMFSHRVQCIEKQLQTKGVSEMIADLGGIRLAFNAFRRSLLQVGKNFTAKDGAQRSLAQSFFIDFAQFFCGINRKEVVKHSGPDVHEADELRVKQSLMHFEEFSKTFQCPMGAAMNPEKRCRVW